MRGQLDLIGHWLFVLVLIAVVLTAAIMFVDLLAVEGIIDLPTQAELQQAEQNTVTNAEPPLWISPTVTAIWAVLVAGVIVLFKIGPRKSGNYGEDTE